MTGNEAEPEALAPPTDIEELMRRDPLLLTKPELGAIIEEMRQYRHRFNAGAVKPPAKKKAPAKKAKAGGEAPLSVADLMKEE